MNNKSREQIIKEALCWRVAKSYYRALGNDHMIGMIERIVEKKLEENEGPE